MDFIETQVFLRLCPYFRIIVDHGLIFIRETLEGTQPMDLLSTSGDILQVLSAGSQGRAGTISIGGVREVTRQV
jgi:hypothetical protein